MLALVAFLIPVFVRACSRSSPAQLPALSQFMVNFSARADGHEWYIFIIVRGSSVIFGGFITFKRLQAGQAVTGTSFKLRFPMRIGEVVQKVAIARWSRTLSSLVAAGVPMIQSLEITGRTSAATSSIERLDGQR